MTRPSTLIVCLLGCLAAAALPASAQEGQEAFPNPPESPAHTAWARGRDAERAGKTEEALAAYSEALRDDPGNREYRALVERMRFVLATSLSNQAERAMLADNPALAATELRRALSFDPENEVARERLRQLERHAVQETSVTPQYAASSPQLSPQPGTRDFNIRGTARDAYNELARQFGLSAIFDEDATSAKIQFRVSGVDFRTALDLLGEQTGTFVRPLDPHTFFVANDTPQKRKEYLPQIERTLILPDSEKPEQANEIVRAVRDITGLTHSQYNTASRTLTIRGAERDVALADALVRELEQPRGEVMLEIDVLEVDRIAAQTLGIVPPSSAQIVTLSKSELQQAEQSTNGLVGLIEQLFGTPTAFAGSSTQQIAALLGTGSTSLSTLVPPLIAFGGGQTIFLATLPGASANFANSLSAVYTADRILLRAEDGEPASFFVGERYPINFSTLSNEFTTQGAQPGITVSTLATGTAPQGAATVATRLTSSNLDIITANYGPENSSSNAGSVSVLLGNGDGTFQTNVDYPAGTSPVAVATATFRATTASGTPPVDLAVVDQGTNSVQILLGNGDGTFQAPKAYAVGSEPVGIVIGDWNLDGHPDIAVTNFAGNSISVLLGNGDGTFVPATTIPLPTGQGPTGITTATLNGNPDLIVTNALTNTATVFLGDGHGNFTAQPAIDTGTLPVAVATADFNGDGLPDFAVANQTDGTVSIFLNSGTASAPVFNSRTDYTVGDAPDALVAGLFTSSGSQDLVSSNSSDGTVTVLFGAGDGTFPDSIPIQVGAGVTCSSLPAPAAPCQGLTSGEYNTSTGLLDAAVTDFDNNTVTVVFNSNQIATPNQQLPYPGFQYEDIGIKAKATPHIHPSGEVTVTLNLELRGLSADNYNGIPVLTNRTIEQTVRLHPNEPSVLSGIYSNQETLGVTGSPGTADIPGLQDVLSSRSTQTQQTELIIVLNPRTVRVAPRSGQVFYAGRERQATSAGAGEPEPREQPEAVPGQPPAPGRPSPSGEPAAPGQIPEPGQIAVPGQPPARPAENPQGAPPTSPTRP